MIVTLVTSEKKKSATYVQNHFAAQQCEKNGLRLYKDIPPYTIAYLFTITQHQPLLNKNLKKNETAV